MEYVGNYRGYSVILLTNAETWPEDRDIGTIYLKNNVLYFCGYKVGETYPNSLRVKSFEAEAIEWIKNQTQEVKVNNVPSKLGIELEVDDFLAQFYEGIDKYLEEMANKDYGI